MATKFKIKIEINCEDIIDFKLHMSMVRENIIALMKLPDTYKEVWNEPIEFEGINSHHKITITK